MKLYWDTPEDIAEQLFEAQPETDPLSIRFTDLLRWVQTWRISATTRRIRARASSKPSKWPGWKYIKRKTPRGRATAGDPFCEAAMPSL